MQNKQTNQSNNRKSFSEQIVNLNKEIRIEYIKLVEQEYSRHEGIKKPAKPGVKKTKKQDEE